MNQLSLNTFDSFRYRNYLLLWVASLCFVAGFRLQLIVLGWFTYDQTGSPLLTALVVSLDLVPYMLLGPVAGLLGDAWDRRKLVASSFGGMTLLVVGMALLVTLDLLQIWHLFAFSFLSGVFYIAAESAMMALIPNVVPRQSLVNAFALNSLGVNSAKFVAPAGKGRVILASLGIAALATVGFSLSPWYGLSLGILAVLGAVETILYTTSHAAIQSITPGSYRGRIGGLMNMLEGFSPMGSLISGALAQRYGAPRATLVAGIITIALTLVFVTRFTKLRNLEE